MTIQRSLRNACARMIVVALALLLYLGAVHARAEADGMLRVKLARLGSPSVIEMTADCDYTLTGDRALRIPAGTKLTVAAQNGGLTLSANGTTVDAGASAILTRAASGSVGAQFLTPALSNRFCGDLQFAASGDVITVVLRIYVEDYLYGVVGYEMAPSSGIEALKAQAIVARNYALRQKAARADAAYDLTDAGDALSFRGYSGASEYADVLRAVDATKGQLIYYDGSAATCYYCDSNGGQIESSANALGVALPYSTLRDDPYDLEGSGAKKTASIRKDALELAPGLERALYAALAEAFEAPTDGILRIETIDAITPGEARFDAPSRLYASLNFLLTVSTGEGSPATQVQVNIPTYGGLEDWYDLSINADPNETVWIDETDRAFEITFRRSGSGLGMSQRGAQVMAKKGFTCAEILEYYYPGTNVATLSLDDDARSARSAKIDGEPIAAARLSQKTRLYASADESVAALTTLPAGATVEVYAVQGDWAALGSGGTYGFAHTDALTDFALIGVTAATVKNETVAKVGSAVNVLQLPVKGAKSLANLLGGDAVRLDGYTDAWARVTTEGGVEGFIPRDALTLQGEAAGDGEIVTAPENTLAMLTDDAGLYVNADDTVSPKETLAKGSYVQILAYNRSWAYARTEGGHTGFLKLSGLSAVETPQASAEPDPGEGGAITVVEGEVYRAVSAEALPMFERNDSASPVLATLEKGAKVRLGAYNEVWACVRWEGVTGFVLLSGLTDEVPESEEIEGGAITVVKGEQFATVVADCPLYPSYDASETPLTRLTQGERVQLGAYNRRWACVRVDGAVGFVPVEALELSAGDAPLEGDGVSYLECEAEATARVELYENADFTGDVLAELNKGARLHVYAFDRATAYVEYNGVRGFVALRYLNRVD